VITHALVEDNDGPLLAPRHRIEGAPIPGGEYKPRVRILLWDYYIQTKIIKKNDIRVNNK